jgi:DNA-binding MarR family transcriptional regulator
MPDERVDNRRATRAAAERDATRAAASEFAALFPAIYLRFHRRDDKQSELTAASRAVLTHLSMSGPITVGEAARHFHRAQSVVSEIFDQLAAKGLVERARDASDRRRAQIWLTDAGVAVLVRDREVLSRELLAAAMAEMTAGERAALLAGCRALVRAIPQTTPSTPTHATIRRRS